MEVICTQKRHKNVGLSAQISHNASVHLYHPDFFIQVEGANKYMYVEQSLPEQ